MSTSIYKNTFDQDVPFRYGTVKNAIIRKVNNCCLITTWYYTDNTHEQPTTTEGLPAWMSYEDVEALNANLNMSESERESMTEAEAEIVWKDERKFALEKAEETGAKIIQGDAPMTFRTIFICS